MNKDTNLNIRIDEKLLKSLRAVCMRLKKRDGKKVSVSYFVRNAIKKELSDILERIHL